MEERDSTFAYASADEVGEEETKGLREEETKRQPSYQPCNMQHAPCNSRFTA